jgi:hypothetical protein
LVCRVDFTVNDWLDQMNCLAAIVEKSHLFLEIIIVQACHGNKYYVDENGAGGRSDSQRSFNGGIDLSLLDTFFNVGEGSSGQWSQLWMNCRLVGKQDRRSAKQESCLEKWKAIRGTNACFSQWMPQEHFDHRVGLSHGSGNFPSFG